jgi:small subunit ribosomal protein S4e
MKSHLKRLAMPKTWDIKRKTTTFIIRPHPGGGKHEHSIPLQILLRDVLKFAKTAKEVRYILNKKEVLVNGRRRREPKFPVGLMDVVDIPELKTRFRIILNRKGTIASVELPESEATHKLFKIADKTLVRKGKVQLNFSDGSNMLADKDSFRTGDAVIYDFGKKKIVQQIAFEKGASVYLTGGKYVGQTGKIDSFRDGDIIIKTDSGDMVQTLRDYAMVVGKDKPVITLIKEK